MQRTRQKMDGAWTRGRVRANGIWTGSAKRTRGIAMSKDRFSKIVTPFDKRIVHRNGKADGYDEHIAALKCVKCGSKEACGCTWRKK